MTEAAGDRVGDLPVPFGDAIYHLSRGVAFTDLPRKMSREHPEVTIGDIRAGVSATARLVERRPLSSAGKALFAQNARDRLREGETDSLARIDMAALPGLAATALDRLARPSTPVAAQPPDGLQALACYAATVLSEDLHRRRWRSERREGFLRRGVTDEDDTRLEDFFLVRGQGTGLRPESLFMRWIALVQGLEADVRYCAAEYANELDGRDVLDAAMTLVAPPAGARSQQEIAPWNARFSQATRYSRVAPTYLPYPGTWAPHAWWWYQVPRGGLSP